MSQGDLHQPQTARKTSNLEHMLEGWDSLDRGWKANAISLLLFLTVMLI